MAQPKAVPKVAVAPKVVATAGPKVAPKAVSAAPKPVASPPPAPVPPNAAAGAPDKSQQHVAKMASNDLVVQLRQVVGRSTRRWKILIVLEALGLAIAVPLGYFLLMLLLDNLIHLPTWGRFVACGLFFGTVGGFGWWLARQWKQARFTEDQVAIAMEKQSKGVDNRLINAIQIARDVNSRTPELNNAVIQENYTRLKQIELQQASKIKPALIRLSVATLMIAFGVCFWVLRPDIFKSSGGRLINPFSKTKIIYRTELTVEPGNVQASPGSDVVITIRIEGQKPDELVIQRNVAGVHTSDTIPVNGDHASYTFKNLERSTTYWVKGGDFSSPSYEIDIPTPPQINLVKVQYHYPEYTRMPDMKTESAGADLEALFNTRATLTFVLDQASDEAVMLLEKVVPPAPVPKAGETDKEKPATAPEPSIERIALKKNGPTEYTGDVTFNDVLGYQLETHQGKQTPRLSPKYALHIMADQAPSLTLTGMNKQNEAQVSTIYPLKAVAADDYGLVEVGIFYARPVVGSVSTNAPAADAKVDLVEWKPINIWKVSGSAKDFTGDYALPVATMGVTEGDRIEIALRGKDADPLKANQWTTGESYTLLVGGEGASFQVLYEQILKTEADVRQQIAAEGQSIQKATDWMAKLDPASGLRWDDQKNLGDLGNAMRDQSRYQDTVRLSTGAVAREMPQQAGNLRMSLGILADTEMVRSSRILESVLSRDNPQTMRAALAEARLTQERTVRSMEDLLGQYVKFRQDWELANMTPFTKMLADRQFSLRDESGGFAENAPPGNASDLIQKSNSQRQQKLLALAGLAQTAFTGIAERVTKVDPTLGKSFSDAAAGLDGAGVKAQMQAAGADLAAGRWKDGAAKQTLAGDALGAIYVALKKAQAEAAARTIEQMKEEKKKLAGQKEIEELKAGNSEDMVSTKEISISDLITMKEKKEAAEKAAAMKDGLIGGKIFEFKFDDAMKEALKNKANEGMRPDFSQMSLGNTPGGATPRAPNTSDLPPNAVEAPKIPDKLEDLVGKLLEEADEMKKDFETMNINTAMTMLDTGTVGGKLSGRMNSNAAVGLTGNMKPPTTNIGGTSGAGRKGARAHGKVAGDEAVNRRGRDEAQDGDDEAPDQAGLMKEVKTDDMQKDPSAGVGGKRTASDESQFSPHDAGEWKDKYAERMEKPKAVNKIVERQGKPLDPRVAEMLRDMTGTQEQMIERVKVIKKEFKNLYLPTDYLDDIEKQMTANLERMKERPNPDVFRMQAETIDRLRNEMSVFNRAVAGFQASVPRDQAVRGRVLDEPAWQTTPGYEDAVKYYYEKLSER